MSAPIHPEPHCRHCGKARKDHTVLAAECVPVQQGKYRVFEPPLPRSAGETTQVETDISGDPLVITIDPRRLQRCPRCLGIGDIACDKWGTVETCPECAGTGSVATQEAKP